MKIHRICATMLIVSCFEVCMSCAYGQAGTWSPLKNGAPATYNPLLLTDGSVMVQQGAGTEWFRLKPDASGNYVNGTWSQLASMNDSRLYFASVVLKDGRVMVGGGEYGTGSATIEIYDPVANTWTRSASWPNNDIGDSTAAVMADGRVLLLPRYGRSWVYDPTTDIWTPACGKNRNNSEQSVARMRDGSFLVPWDATSQKYIPSLDQWFPAGSPPNGLIGPSSEIGPAVLLYDGRVFCLGATGGHTDFYTESAAPTGPGTWQAGPDIPGKLVCDDAPAAVMPNGHVLLVADVGYFSGPSKIFEFDPVANSYTDVGGPAGYAAESYLLLVLPSGQVLLSNGQIQIYTPVGSPNSAWQPTINSVVPNSDGSYKVTGAQLNGLTEGAYYGDDAQASSNYPLVRLVNGSNVYYARTFNHSTMGLATGSTPVSTNFVTTGIPAGAYSLYVVANGIASAPVPFTAPANTTSISGTVTSSGKPLFGVNVSDGVRTAASGGDGVYTIYGVPNGSYTLTPSFKAGGVFTPAALTVTVSGTNVRNQNFAAIVGPSFVRQPTSQTCGLGRTATFIVTATGTAPLAYQWRKNGVNISGATGTWCVTPATTTADNGASFSCVVSNSIGSATSNAAKLTLDSAENYVARVNFQPGNFPVPTDYSMDTGALYTAARGYGWDVALPARDRTPGNPDPRLVTFVTTTTVATWNYNLSNGKYLITLACGDAVFSQGPQRVLVQGAIAIDNVSTAINQFATLTDYPVTVSNGQLTIAIGGGGGSTMLDYIDVKPAGAVVTPSITSALTAAGTVNAAFTYKITATNSPTSFNATGLPAGLTVNTATGVITGVPMATGTSSVTISAANSSGTGSALLALTINAQTVAPSITTQPVSLTVTAGQTATFSVVASGTAPLTYQWQKNGANISGANSASYTTPATTAADSGSTYRCIVNNSVGSATSSNATLTVNPAKPVITSALTASGTVNTAFKYTIAATNAPTSYNATGLPVGLTVNTTTGVISGTPTTSGTSNVSISATDAGGTGSATLVLTVAAANQPPAITSAASATPNPANVGQSIAFSVAASDSNGDTLAYTWAFGDGGAAAGAAVTHAYAAAGDYTATVTVSDGHGGSVSSSVNEKINAGGTYVARINFQPTSAAVLTGYQKDDGSVFDATRGYGWNAWGVVGSRERNVDSDQRLDTFVFAGNTVATWSYALPNGSYLVTLASGDPSYKQGPQRVVVQGNVVINNTTTTANQFVKVTDLPVTVSTGQLTIAIGGGGAGANTILNYLDVKTALGIAADSTDDTVATLSPAPAPLTVQKLAGTVRFDGTGHDTASLAVAIPGLPALSKLGGTTVSVAVGGVSAAFKLDAKGHGKSTSGALSISSRGAIKIALTSGTWSQPWSDAGIDPTAKSTNAKLKLNVMLSIADTLYSSEVTTNYSSKAHVSGKFRN